MMVYLLFFRTVHLFNLPTPSEHTNVLQMILTLKIIGYAFEKNFVTKKYEEAKELDDAENEIKNFKFIDVFHYCFNYIGLLASPYHTYRTFYDYFNTPYYKHVNTSKAMFQKFKQILLYGFLLIGSLHLWPLEYMTRDDFYKESSYFYRLFYIWPAVFIFRMRCYTGILLAENVCINAGFGAYPRELKSKCGHGPSVKITSEDLKNSEYDFETIENFNIKKFEKCLTLRESLKHWNRCIQYWLAIFIHKRVPNKKYRLIATMMTSAW